MKPAPFWFPLLKSYFYFRYLQWGMSGFRRQNFLSLFLFSFFIIYLFIIYIYTFYYFIYISSHLPQRSLKCPLLPPSCLLFIFYNLETNYCCLLECWLSSLTWSSTGNHSNIEFMSAMVIPSPEDTMAQHHPLLWHICSFCPFLEAVPWALVAAAVTQMSHQWMTVHQLLFLSMLTSS